MSRLIMTSLPVQRILSILLLLAAIHQFGSAALIQAKAHLAQILIGSAWEKTLNTGGKVHQPWPWADTWPVARLEVPKHQVELFVLWGSAGNSLAFGPGYEPASALPGQAGTVVIGGHRDTHFQFLQALEINTLLSLQMPSGQNKTYQVSAIRIVDTGKEPNVRGGEGGSQLLLVTCYPFNALFPGGPLRYVVTAREVASA